MHFLTLHPYNSNGDTFACLHKRDIVKQLQIYQRTLAVLEGRSNGKWLNAPAVKAWEGHTEALKHTLLTAIDYYVAIHRTRYEGYRPAVNVNDLSYPVWYSQKGLAMSHRNYLMRLRPKYYSTFWKYNPEYKVLRMPRAQLKPKKPANYMFFGQSTTNSTTTTTF